MLPMLGAATIGSAVRMPTALLLSCLVAFLAHPFKEKLRVKSVALRIDPGRDGG